MTDYSNLSAPDLEQQIVSALIEESAMHGDSALPTLRQVIEQLPIEAFSSPTMRKIYEAQRNLILSGTACGLIELKSQGVDAREYATSSLIDFRPVVAKLCKIHTARMYSLLGDKVADLARSGAEGDVILAEIARSLPSITSDAGRAKVLSQLGDFEAYLRALNEGRIPKVSTGFKALDRALGGGIEEGSHWIWAQRTNGGKTVYACQLARHRAKQGLGTLYMSGEMKMTSGPVPIHRVKLIIACREAEVQLSQFAEGMKASGYTWGKVAKASQEVDKWPLHIDSQRMTLERVDYMIRSGKREGWGVVVIDNLNFVEPPHHMRSRARHEQLGYVSHALADAFHESGVTGLTLHQANREAAKGKDGADVDRPPLLEELAYSDEIAHPADLVFTAYRNNKVSDSTIGVIAIRKSRQGGIGDYSVGWSPSAIAWGKAE